MDTLGYAISQRFLHLEKYALDELGIIAVVFGGSVVYCHAENGTMDDASDFDLALFVRNKKDIVNMLRFKRSLLMRILCITKEECQSLHIPLDESPVFEQMDGVRFAGYDIAGIKRSAKILSLESLRRSHRCINLLSHKDRRVYRGFTLDGLKACRLQQAIKLDNGLVLLHDPWLFEGKSNQCVHEAAHNKVAFGITADLLLTGLWFIGEASVGRDVRETLTTFASERTGTAMDPSTMSFARSPRFGKLYRDWLVGRWQSSARAERNDTDRCGHCPCIAGQEVMLLGPVTNHLDLNQHQICGHITTLGSEIAADNICAAQNSCQVVPISKSPFSSNSTVSLIALSPRHKSPDQHGKVVFCKQSSQKHIMAECEGALQAAKFFPQIQHPKVVGSRLLYPLFRGRCETELQLDFAWTHDSAARDLILDIELRKAEDMLRAYCLSLRAPTEHIEPIVSPAINRFFSDRLRGNCRLEEFYGTGVSVNGQSISLDRLCQLNLCVNGSKLPSLGVLLDDAYEVLRRVSGVSSPIAFGLGDGHGGNVMLASATTTEPHRKLLYVDYEVAGFHSPLLDLAKPLYNDVFFRALYADSIASPPQVRVNVESDWLFIDTQYGHSSLAQAMLGIKRRFLIEPLFRFAKERGHNLHQATDILTKALLACGILTRNFAGKEDAFFINLSISVALAQAESLEDIWRTAGSIFTAKSSA